MKLAAKDMLRRLGAGESIDSICADAGISREEFESWWESDAATRLPKLSSAPNSSIGAEVEIVRDQWGIPHIFTRSDQDLFFGYGVAMAQDRLWQMDYLRRKAMGRLSEILGREALELDTVVRTVGINRIAAKEVERLAADTLKLLEAFSAGINLVIEQSRDRPPVEFDLLDYKPEPWTPLDSVAIWGEFRWYVTGRLPVIVIPELAKRALGGGPLYEAFLTAEAGDESILPAGSYAVGAAGATAVGSSRVKATGTRNDHIVSEASVR